MIKNFQIDSYACTAAVGQQSAKVVYMIYPHVDGFTDAWLGEMSLRCGVTIVMVYVPLDRWNDDLTPWPEAAEAKGFQPFGGKAADFYNELVTKIIPSAETTLGLSGITRRDLIGVSLAGLFTLWQWMQHDVFTSIGCLSGSFWYEGFIEWFENQQIPQKSGKAYFLLGTAEPKAKIMAYRSVGVNTEAVVKRLQSAGIACRFDWVPGNHFANPLPRAERALDALFGNREAIS